MRATNGIHLGCSLLLPVGTGVNWVQTLKVYNHAHAVCVGRRQPECATSTPRWTRHPTHYPHQPLQSATTPSLPRPSPPTAPLSVSGVVPRMLRTLSGTVLCSNTEFGARGCTSIVGCFSICLYSNRLHLGTACLYACCVQSRCNPTTSGWRLLRNEVKVRMHRACIGEAI
jgi:hypothetical protein